MSHQLLTVSDLLPAGASEPESATQLEEPEHPYSELGRRLLAAVISYRTGVVSVDYALRRELPRKVNKAWCDLGEVLLTARSSEAIVGEVMLQKGRTWPLAVPTWTCPHCGREHRAASG